MKSLRTQAALVFTIAAVIAWASSLRAGGERKRPVKPEDVTLVGKIVDLQSFMTGIFTGADAVRAAQDCIRQGVPAALETEEGLIVLGMGERGPGRTLIPLALKKVEVKGKLYDKDGLQYLDMASATLVKEKGEAERGKGDEERDDVPDEEPEP